VRYARAVLNLVSLPGRAAEAGGRGAGGFLGGLFNNPGVVAIALGIGALLIFGGDIRKAFGSLGESIGSIGDVQFPDITLPEINFPEITFPEFPDFTSIFENFFNQFGGGEPGPVDIVPGPVDPGGTGPGETTVFPPGCTLGPNGIIECPTPPTFDVCSEFPELCQGEPLPGPGDPILPGPGASIIGGGPTDPVCVDIPLITGGSFNTCTGEASEPISPPVQEPFMPPVELPGGFVGGGPSFEGGTIFETTDESCQDLSCVIDRNPGFTASQAADRLAEIQGTLGDFDFGTNTGSGFGPGDDPTGPIVTGGATPESEAQRAACTSCELFNLNCAACQGLI